MYLTRQDPMTDDVFHSAANHIVTRPPSSPPTLATLHLMTSPAGHAAMVSLKKTRLTCGTPCRIRVRFDDDRPVTLHAERGKDASPDTLQFTEASTLKLLKGLQKATRHVRIEFRIQERGRWTVTFPKGQLPKWPGWSALN